MDEPIPMDLCILRSKGGRAYYSRKLGWVRRVQDATLMEKRLARKMADDSAGKKPEWHVVYLAEVPF